MKKTFDTKAYREQRMQILSMISHYQISNRDMEAQIAINNREIAKLRFQLAQLQDNSLNDIEETAA